MKYILNRSLIVTITVAISVIMCVLIGSMTMLSYQTSKNNYLAEFDRVGAAIAAQLQTEHDQVSEAFKRLSSNELDHVSFSLLRERLDAMTADSLIGNTYILAPDIELVDDAPFVTTLQVNEALFDAGLTPGTHYGLPPLFQSAYHEVMEKGSTRTPLYVDDLGTWISYLHSIKDDQGRVIAVLGLDFEYRLVEKDLNALLIRSILNGVAFALPAVILLFLLIWYSLRPLRQLADMSHRAAAGDLTVTIPVANGNEIGKTAAAFNHMIRGLRELIVSIQRTSSEVSGSAADLRAGAAQTAQASQEIAESIQDIAEGSELQLRNADDCRQSMTEMAAGANRIAESSQVVAELAAKTSRDATEGEAVIAANAKQMQAIERDVTDTLTNIHELKRLGGNIGDIMSLIRDIAGQTNLLALNASIEAARAGEYGRGFAVVAQEIRKLAERSSQSSDQIDGILQGIGAKTEEAAVFMERSVREARRGTQVSEEAGNTFRQIAESIRTVSAQIQEVSAAAEQMSAGTEQVAASLGGLAQAATGSSMNSARVAASSEEQLASMEDVSSLSEQLSEAAGHLDQAIKRFRV